MLCSNSLPNDKILDWFKFKAFVDNKLNMTQASKFVSDRAENIVGKGEKCWLPAFSLHPHSVSKKFFLRAIKSLDCLVKSKNLHQMTKFSLVETESKVC